MKQTTIFRTIIFILTVLIFQIATIFASTPETWLGEWKSPTATNRPLQIIHGWFGDRTTPEKLRYFKDDCGLGGLVINVNSNNYLRNENEWKRLVDVVRSAKEIGLRIWIYDEDGYPSLMAGGVVLEGHPELESLALVYDAAKEDETAFSVRPAYEYTHAASKYSELRRYPNPLNPAATQRFIEVTHESYKKHLGELHHYVEAYFTDEPSLNAVNIGTIPPEVQKTLKIADPIDPNVPLLPMVVWSDALAKESFNKKSLFTGNSDADKNERQRFWETVARINARNYYQKIRDWCRVNNVLSSGHTLHEEIVVGHVPLDGNKLSVLRMMDIPGLDMLSSDPRVFAWGGWKTAGFPASAAALNGTRLLFTEISDFSQKMNADKKPANLLWMQAAAAWQAIWGVTEFTLYYPIEDRSPAIHKAYCDYVGRLNAVLRSAKPVRSMLLYYPITDIQREYLPTAEPLNLKLQSLRMQEMIRSFDRLGEMLVRNQIPFIITDTLGIQDGIEFSQQSDLPILIPRSVQIPNEIDQSRLQFCPASTSAAHQGCGLIEGEAQCPTGDGLKLKKLIDTAETPITPEAIRNGLEQKQERLIPASDWISFGKFERDNKNIYVVLNAEDKPYQGTLQVPNSANWSRLDPTTGNIEELPPTNTIPISLEPFQTVIFVE
jgi:hypothetical protein